MTAVATEERDLRVEEPPRPNPRRVQVAVAVLMAAFLAFIAQAVRLQIFLADEHLARAAWRVDSVAEIPPPRGEIRDANGELLAGNAPAVDIAIDVKLLLNENRDVLDQVRPHLESLPYFSRDEWDQWVVADVADVPGDRLLARGVSPTEASRLAHAMGELGVRAIIRRDSYRRVYPNGALASRTIGRVDGPGVHGVAGVERALDANLVGDSLQVPLQRDATRKAYLLGASPDLTAATGDRVDLTIDRRIQAVAEEELAATVTHFEAVAAVAIVSRPATGELLAVASWPPFDPNAFDESAASADAGWANPALTSTYEPGSTGKIFTFAAALEEGLVTYDELLDCQGGVVQLGRARIIDRHCHGQIHAWEVIRDSSNIGAMAMGTRLTQQAQRGYLAAFGFGSRTGVGLPGDSTGVLAPTPWPYSQQATVSYGYGFAVTPLQLNMATAAIANGGVLMQPQIVRAVRSANGELVSELEPNPVRRVVSARTASLVTQAMATVVSRDGTAALATVPGYTAAGKTGTARMLSSGGYSDTEYLAVFTGFVPLDRPELVITVFVGRPNSQIGYYGGVVSAPVFSGIARRALPLLGRAPETDATPSSDPIEHAASAEAVDGLALSADDRLSTGAPTDTGAPTVPDLTGGWVADAVRRAEALGLDVAVVGTGRVVAQWPAAGSDVVPGTRVVLTLEAP
ncbi:MAG: transpeptidase family protein [Myxococcales bacterium]|nr:transpeptidase family protein [Myxococcales bacterium]